MVDLIKVDVYNFHGLYEASAKGEKNFCEINAMAKTAYGHFQMVVKRKGR